MSLSLPSGMFSLYNDAVDNIWSKTITIYYPESTEECPNCYFNGVKSNGVYKTGGPYPFDDGSLCPYCNGDGIKSVETTEDIPARMYYDKKYWTPIEVAANYTNAELQTVIDMNYLVKIQQSNCIVPKYYPGIENYQARRLFRLGDYFPQGFTQNNRHFFITFWGSNVKV